jgi:hypothetical protein
MTPHSVNVIADTSRMPNSFRQKPHDRIADWRTSGQGLAALRDFGPANASGQKPAFGEVS